MDNPASIAALRRAVGSGANIAIAVFSIVLIAAAWIAVVAQVRYEREQAIEQEFAENSNVALGFQELTLSVLQNAEQTLRLIARDYARQGARLSMQKLIDDGLISPATLNLAGVIDEHGRLLVSAPEFKPVNVADREYFRFHQLNAAADMHIGKPVLSRVRADRWVVPLSLRINKPDGSFGGLAYLSLDTAYFNRLFEQASLGEQGLVLLVGLDGITRARRSGQTVSSGQDMRASTLFAEQRERADGHLTSTGRNEGVRRLISYRTLKQYSLVVAAGTSETETLAAWQDRKQNYYTAAALISGFIALFAGGVLFFLARQQSAASALSSSNARFGIAFNQTAVGVVFVSHDGQLLEVNDRFCSMLNYTREELLSLNILDITHPDDRENSRTNMNRVREDPAGTAVPLLEKRYLRKDGSPLWAAVAVAMMRDRAEAADYFMGVIQDITVRKKAELVLADNERRFRALTRHALDLIVVTDRHGVITYVSPSISRITGYTPGEALGKAFLDFVHPADLPTSRAVFGELAATAGALRTVEQRFRHKDGREIVLHVAAKSALDDPVIDGIIVNAVDITEQKRAQSALLKVNRALQAISSCNSILIRAANEQTLVQGMCDNIVEVGGYKFAWVGVVEHDEGKTVRAVAYAGYPEGSIEQAHISYADDEQGRGPVGAAIRRQKTQIAQDARNDPDFRPWQANAARLGYGAVAALPLISFDEVIGVLTIYAAEANAYDEEEVRLLSELADDLAFGMVALRTRAAHEQSEKHLIASMEGTVNAMASTLELRDAYTAGHQRRVAELAVAIARELGMTVEETHGLHLAAVIHDLGKIQIPAEILSKPSRLSKIEDELIKTHPQAGYDILKDVEFPWPIAQMVYQHHERLDGSGYPRGLKDAEILPGAKILAVADTVEAMASHRPYRAGLGIDKALDEIVKNRGTAYDPAAVDACVKLFHEKRFAFTA